MKELPCYVGAGGDGRKTPGWGWGACRMLRVHRSRGGTGPHLVARPPPPPQISPLLAPFRV